MSDGKTNNPTQQNGQELTCFETFKGNETQKSMAKGRKNTRTRLPKRFQAEDK